MPRTNSDEHRIRASVVVIDRVNKRALLMYRKVKGKEKYVLPGGGIDSPPHSNSCNKTRPNDVTCVECGGESESLDQAAIREIKEETTLDVTITKKLATIKYKTADDHVFLATEFTGTAQLAGEELERSHENNYYEPRWLTIDEIKNSNIPIHPRWIIKAILKELLQNN